MSELRANTISDVAGTGPVTLTGQYAAKAWVNFNGTGTVAIREDGNVSSITDNGTGDYTVNFSTALTDANYAAVGSAKTQANTTVTSDNNTLMVLPAIYATDSIRLFTARDGASGPKDAENTNLAVFR